jgi:hypothetical protein
LLTGINLITNLQEWIGVFGANPNSLPMVVFKAGSFPNLVMGGLAQGWKVPIHTDLFEVLPILWSLMKVASPGVSLQDGL